MKSEISIKAAIYLRAAELVEIGHCKFKQARDADGKEVSPKSSAATSWCLMGAIMRAEAEYGDDKPFPGKPHSAHIERQLRTEYHALWNNAPERTAAEVAAKLREQAFA